MPLPARHQADPFSMVGKPLPTSFNRDVPQHVVQKILKHDTPEMTALYARLSDKTVREHWEKARKVSATGQPVRLARTARSATPPGPSTSCPAPPGPPERVLPAAASEDLPACQLVPDMPDVRHHARVGAGALLTTARCGTTPDQARTAHGVITPGATSPPAPACLHGCVRRDRRP